MLCCLSYDKAITYFQTNQEISLIVRQCTLFIRKLNHTVTVPAKSIVVNSVLPVKINIDEFIVRGNYSRSWNLIYVNHLLVYRFGGKGVEDLIVIDAPHPPTPRGK